MKCHVSLKSLLLGSTAVFLVSTSWAKQPAWDDRLDHTTVKDRLITEPVKDTMSFRRYLSEKGQNSLPSHSVRLIILEDGLKAIFKEGTYHFAEVAAYRASNALGLRLVPPTVFRMIDGTPGSLQFYVKGYDLAGLNTSKELKKVGKKAKRDMRLFYYVFGQWDVHGGNQLISKDGSLALIDNSGILHKTHGSYGGDLFCSKGKNFELPSDTSPTFPHDKVEGISGANVYSVFKPYVSKHQLNKFGEFRYLHYVIWNHRLYIKLNPSLSKRYTKKFYASTLAVLKQLTHQQVHEMWAELSLLYPEYVDDLVSLTLSRRDEVVTYAEQLGTIIHDTYDPDRI